MEATNVFLSEALSYEEEKKATKKGRTNLLKPQFEKNYKLK